MVQYLCEKCLLWMPSWWGKECQRCRNRDRDYKAGAFVEDGSYADRPVTLSRAS